MRQNIRDVFSQNLLIDHHGIDPDQAIGAKHVQINRVHKLNQMPDVNPRLAPTHEWDIAAGHAILATAGGTVMTPTGEPLSYGRSGDNFLVSGFVAMGDYAAAKRSLQFRTPIDLAAMDE